MNKLDKNNKESNKFKIGDVVRTNKLYQENLKDFEYLIDSKFLKNLIVKDFSYEYSKDDFGVKGDPIGYIYDFGSNVCLHEDYLKK